MILHLVAISSFLAGTRNLMFLYCRMYFFVASICGVIWIRSLVPTRDDGLRALYLILWVYTFYRPRMVDFLKLAMLL